MKTLWNLSDRLVDKSFWDIISEKKENLVNRAWNKENLIRQFNSRLGWLYSIVKYFDEKFVELKEIIKNYGDISVSDIDYSRVELIIRDYSNLVANLENFKEWEPEINSALSSPQYSQLERNIQTLNNNRNWINTIDKYCNDIDNIINTLKINIIYFEKDKLSKADDIAKELIDKKAELEEALSVIESIIKNKEKNTTTEIKSHNEYFENEAKNNKWILLKDGKWKWKVWQYFFPTNYISFKIIWLIASMFIWIVVIWDIYRILDSEKSLSTWDSLLRISLLTIAFYFIVYFSKQYSNHRNLYKSYTFKAISLKVMLWLSEISSVSEKTMIYEKALDKIFSEPNINISEKDWDIVNIVKDSIPAKVPLSK